MSNKDILEKIDHDAGMGVPEGYFADFEAKMAAALPHQPWEDTENAPVVLEVKRTTWQKLRPYVYMAAMFAGIWLMMHIFTFVGPQSDADRIDSNPVLAQAIQNEQFVEDVTDGESIEYMDELLDEMYEQGVSINSLREALIEENKL